VKEETHNTQRHIHTERHRHTERDTHTERDMHTLRETDICTEKLFFIYLLLNPFVYISL